MLIKHWQIFADWHWHRQSADWHHLIVVWRESGSGRRRWKSGVALLDEDCIKIQLTGSTMTFNTRVVSTFNYTAESSIVLSLLLLLRFEGNRKSVSRKKSMLSFQALSSTKLYQLRNLKHDWLADLKTWKRMAWLLGGKDAPKIFQSLQLELLVWRVWSRKWEKVFRAAAIFCVGAPSSTEWQAGAGGLKWWISSTSRITST